MVISGAFAGLAGGVELAGVHRRAIEGITNNYGFSGVVVALLRRSASIRNHSCIVLSD